jgi:hypothetical protein
VSPARTPSRSSAPKASWSRRLCSTFDGVSWTSRVVQKALGDLAHEMLLGGEVIEERLLRDVGGVADLIHLDGLDAVGREQLGGGGDDAIVHLADATLSSRAGFGGHP